MTKQSSNPDVMAHKKVIQASSVALLGDHGIKQKQIFSWVREAMEEYVSDMPKVSILYNEAYGGYSLSKEFTAFWYKHQGIKSASDDNHTYEEDNDSDTSSSSDINPYFHLEDRIEAVPYIIPFAISILENPQHSGLQEVLWMYHSMNMAKIFNMAQRLLYRKKEKASTVENIQHLREYLADPSSTYGTSEDMNDVITYKLQYSKRTSFETYTKDALERVVATIDSHSIDPSVSGTKNPILRLESMIDDLQTEILQVIREPTLTTILEFISTYDEKYIKPRGIYDRVSEEKTLLYLLCTNGYRDPKTWSFQTSYHEKAIVYLITQPQPQWVTEPEKNPSLSQMHLVYEKFGLACASGKYCNLAIEKMPALMGWSIGEYDGKEKVYID